MYSRVTMNLVGAQTRREWLEGREYLVVPTVMLTEGVFTGNQGPLLYRGNEIGKTPEVWNHKPICLYHPMLNGEGVSACEPEVLERQKIGLIMRAGFDGRLRNESWLDEAKMRTSEEGKGVLNAINEGRMVEVSTGLYHDPVGQPGTWNNKPYTAEVTNIRPDHLAILPDQKGACSNDDGAGLLRNADGDELSHEDIRDQLRALLRSDRPTCLPCQDGGENYTWIQDVFPKYAIAEKNGKVYKVGYKVRKGKVSIVEGEPEEVRKVTTYVTANGQISVTRNDSQQGPVKVVGAPTVPKTPTEAELSDIMKRQQWDSVLKEKYSGVQQEGDWAGWTTDVFANYAIFSKDGKYFRLPYTYDNDKINFGSMEEVEQISEYKSKKGPIDGNTSPQQSLMNAGKTMAPTLLNTKKKIVLEGDENLMKAILTNAIHAGAHGAFHDPAAQTDAHQPIGDPKSDGQVRTLADSGRKGAVDSLIKGGHAKETDRAHLEGLPDDHFESVKKFALKGASMPIQPYSYDGIGDRSVAPSGGTTNAQPTQLTEEAFLAMAPPSVRAIVANHRQQEQAKRGKCIEVIINKNPNYNPKWLETQTTDALMNMAILAGGFQAPTQNYAGQADAPPMFITNTGTTNNAGDGGNTDEGVLSLPNTDWSDNVKAG